MPIEIKKSPAVAISTAIIAVAILGLVFHHDITWPQALGALGLLLAPSIAKKKDSGDDPPKDPPSAPPPLIITPIMLFALLLGCTGATSRATARGAVLAAAEAVKVGDATCAKYALDRRDVDLAKRCETAYTSARDSLLVASTGIDAWDEGKKSDVTCATVHAAENLTAIANEFKSRQLPVPPLLDDAIRLASLLGGCS